MTRRAWLMLGWGIVILVLVDSVVLSFDTQYEPSHTSNKNNDDNERAKGPVLTLILGALADAEEFIEAHEKLFIVLSTFAIAAFTYTLWRTTSGLQRLAAKQAVDMRESLDTAKQSANAAIVSSMPILVPFVTQRAARLYPDKLIAEPYTPRLAFVFQNFGATPGIVRHVRAEIRLVYMDRLPEIDFDKLIAIAPEIIVPGKLYGEAAIIPGSSAECPAFRPISIEEHQLLLNETKNGAGEAQPFQRLYLFAQVIYDDFFDTRHTATFCLKVRRGGYHGQHGGPRYNRITREPIPKN